MWTMVCPTDSIGEIRRKRHEYLPHRETDALKIFDAIFPETKESKLAFESERKKHSKPEAVKK